MRTFSRKGTRMWDPNPLLPGERTNREGLLIVTVRQLALLHGLLDRPEGRAVSYRDWARASLPYLGRFLPCPTFRGLLACIHRIPDTLVTCTRRGTRVECQLTQRGEHCWTCSCRRTRWRTAATRD
jgi:hypothetical protein